ncbi:MAG TPA: hypothetical protein VLE22_00075 [Bryobacteraceae bacterium]|nr:hypothetical protein [Bryobacteraceae bacterium]
MKRFSLLLAAAAAVNALGVPPDDIWKTARANGAIMDDIFRRTRKMMHGWLAHADSQTLLLPDGLPGLIRGKPNDRSVYTPHNSGADNYPFLITTAFFTEPALYRGRMMEMLRNEVRFTNVGGGAIPGNLDFKTRELGPPSFFGAGEYCKDGMVPVTELLGRTPWFYRMVDMMEDFMARAPVKTRFGNLPDTGAELNGDVLQALARLIPMTGDPRFLKWAEQIGDAYIEEILPGSNYLPAYGWDFDKKTATETVGLGDHGNEAIVGLVLLQALETELGGSRAKSYRPVLRKTFDRVLESANPDGFIYRQIRTADLQPVDAALTDCWGYVYASMYAYYQTTGEQKYREAVLRVLKNLAKYRDYDWTKRVNTVDDLADSIEGAIYLVAHEPVPEALAWIDHSIPKMYPYQQPDGVIERWYGDGNWNRTLLLYAMMKTQGARLKDWAPGVELGAVRSGEDLYISVHSAGTWSGSVCLDYARYRRVLNLKKDYARLNQWPEWYTVDENTLYRVLDPDTGNEEIRLGSELKDGFDLRVAGKTARRVISRAAGK